MRRNSGTDDHNLCHAGTDNRLCRTGPSDCGRDAGADHDDLCHAGTNDRLCITGTGDRGRDACAASHYDGDTLTRLVAFSRDQAWFRTSRGTPPRTLARCCSRWPRQREPA